jgi:pyruvate-formate lyase-activating enzyme
MQSLKVELKVEPDLELDAGDRTFASGLLLDLVSALQRAADGDLFALTSRNPAAIETDLQSWSRLTGHAIIARMIDGDRTRWVIRRGQGAIERSDERPLGARLWLYVNFDCNLRCDYCCVRSSPSARRRALGLDRVQRIAREAPPLGVREYFVTGGEPFLLPDIDEIVTTLARTAPVTLLTNALLFHGSRLKALERLRRLPTGALTLQVSLDSPDSALHDAHRGEGTWRRAMEGIDLALREGFRVRFAATVTTDAEEERFSAFLDFRHIAAVDRVIRRVALRGFATAGVALARADLVPEITITAEGVYWHPVGAEDEDLLVTRELFPLARAFEAVREALASERAHSERLAAVFHCA